MSTIDAAQPQPLTTGFRPGVVVLRIRRGNVYFLLPRLWVRGVVPLHEVVPLPRAKPWVVGLAVHDGRPLPVLDLAVCSGTAEGGHSVGVLLGAPDQASFALVISDGPGRFVSVPAVARLEKSTGWLTRIQGCAQTSWWLETARLAAEFKE